MKTRINLPLTEGLTSRQGDPSLTPTGFSTMLNARLTSGGGCIEQTPCFTANAFSAGTFDIGGGPVTDSSSTVTRLLVTCTTATGNVALFSVSDYIVRFGASQIQVIRQTSVTGSTATLYNSVLLVVNSFTGLALTLGNTLQVEMTAAALFRWRKNGGGWTAGLVPSTTGVSIDGGNATLYFLASSGFAGTEATTWTRTDCAADGASSGVLSSLPYQLVGDSLYFCDPGARVMKFVNNSVSDYGVVSVGYRPVYGRSLVVYQNHLIVGGYTTTIPATDNPPSIVACSDLGNLDNFFPTDTNEADVYTLVGEPILSGADVGDGVWRVSVIQNTLYAYTSGGIWGTSYLGLPVVFSFTQVAAASFYSKFRGNVSTPLGDYLVTYQGLVFFDGQTVYPISEKIPYWFQRPRDGASAAAIPTCFPWGFYDYARREMCFYYSASSPQINTTADGFLVYQEDTKTWYFRTLPQYTSAACGSLGGSGVGFAGKITIGYARGYAIEDTAGAGASFDYGGAYTTPLLVTTPFTLGNPAAKTEVVGCSVDADYVSGTASSYVITGVSVELAALERVAASPSYGTAAVWSTSSLNTTLSQRANGRLFVLRIKPVVGSGKASFGFKLYGLGLDVVTAKTTEQ